MTQEQMGRFWLVLIMRVFARPDVGSMRPLSWSTDHPFMVEPVVSGLRQLGIAGMLPMVCLAGETEISLVTNIRGLQFDLLAKKSPILMGWEVMR